MIPFRVCCSQRHLGPVCPDGRVMCCYCFDRFDQADLALDDEGFKTDVCRYCWDFEQKRMNA